LYVFDREVICINDFIALRASTFLPVFQKVFQPNCFELPRLSSSSISSTEAALNVPIHMVPSSGAGK